MSGDKIFATNRASWYVTDPILETIGLSGAPALAPALTLVSLKDKTEIEDQSGVVYQLSCKDCNASYIGESGRKLGKRLSEHKSSAASSKSAVREHVVRSGGHDIDWTGVKVLERESKEFSRRVLEAIQIKSKGPNLNRDKGLDLDPVWDTSLQKRGGAK